MPEGCLAARPHVIVLNGVGSVGKSSTARALQRITVEPFLHVAMDAFLEMLPEVMLGHMDGLIFEAEQDQVATPAGAWATLCLSLGLSS